MNLNRMRQINLILTIVGTLVFTAVWAYVRFAPEDFDQRTQAFAITKIESKFDKTFGDVARSEAADRVSELAGKFSDRLQSRVDAYRESLDQGVDVFIADVLTAACKLDCERREEARQAVEAFFEAAIERYGFALNRIEALIIGEYDAVMSELRADLAIFTGSNAVALCCAFLLSVFRGKSARHLFPIAMALTGTTLLMVCWYIFGQDWVMTLIFSDYWGWLYVWVLAVLGGFMMDIAANKARITSFVFNGVGHVFGGGFGFSPC